MRAVLRGGPYFKIYSYPPPLASAIMALLLVAHLGDPESAEAPPVTPLAMFARDGFTGGLWDSPYAADSTGAATALLGTVAPYPLD
jgi:hypothetical protein